MASTAHKTQDEITEFQDSPAELEKKIEKLAKLVQGAKHLVVATGAGISVNIGVGDFRGPSGKWTLQAQGKSLSKEEAAKRVNTINAIPSLAHMSIVTLFQSGYCKYLISSNTDGLHRRSGIDPRNISELHGNSNKTICNKCGKFGLADIRTRVAKAAKQHGTGVKCPVENCTGEMCDTIINFGEYLLSEVRDSADKNGEKADVLLVLGTSLRVITTDAYDNVAGDPNKSLVIVNKQKTPYDKYCKKGVRIFADTDYVMTELMKKLGREILPWTLNRFVEVDLDPAAASSASSASSSPTTSITVRGIDEVGLPFSWIKSVRVGRLVEDDDNSENNKKNTATTSSATAAASSSSSSNSNKDNNNSNNNSKTKFVPFNSSSVAISEATMYRALKVPVEKKQCQPGLLALELSTFGHRDEPPVVIQFPKEATSLKCRFSLQLHYDQKVWSYLAQCY